MIRLGDLFRRGESSAPVVAPEESVTRPVRVAAAWSWRLIVIAALVALVGVVVAELRYIVIPFFVAVLLAALLVPLKNRLVRVGWPLGLAVATCVVGIIAVVAGLVTLVVLQVRSEFPALQQQAVAKWEELQQWLQGPPLELTPADIDTYLGQVVDFAQSDWSVLWSGLGTGVTTLGHVLTGLLLTLFSLIFLLLDGGRIWRWITGLFPRNARVAIHGGSTAGWVTLSAFVRVQVFVAFVDAVGIGLGAWILGLFFGGFPLVIPIAVIVFLASFVPFVGAIVSGAVAVLVALIYLGPIPAVIMLGIVILVQQLESHVLQPFVIGTAVRIHPLAIVLGVAAGGFVAGIPGTLFAVPLIAFANSTIGYLVRGEWRTNPEPDLDDLTLRVARRAR